MLLLKEEWPVAIRKWPRPYFMATFTVGPCRNKRKSLTIDTKVYTVRLTVQFYIGNQTERKADYRPRALPPHFHPSYTHSIQSNPITFNSIYIYISNRHNQGRLIVGNGSLHWCTSLYLDSTIDYTGRTLTVLEDWLRYLTTLSQLSASTLLLNPTFKSPSSSSSWST